MTTYYLNGNLITEGSDITLNGMKYPYAWLEGTSPSVRASLGIEKDGDITEQSCTLPYRPGENRNYKYT